MIISDGFDGKPLHIDIDVGSASLDLRKVTLTLDQVDGGARYKNRVPELAEENYYISTYVTLNELLDLKKEVQQAIESIING